MFKRVLATLLVVAMLASMAVVVSAEETATDLFGDEILNSITMEEKTGQGLAFRIQMNVKGAQVNGWNEFINDNATATVDGVEYQVEKMGAVMANQATDIDNRDNLTLEDVEGMYILDIPAKYLCAVPEAESCEFAVRITHLPDTAMGRAIACRPYIILKNGDEQITLYGECDISTYNSVDYQNNPEKTPILTAGAPALDGKIAVAFDSAYAAYDPDTYVEAFKVNATLSNGTTNAKSSEGDTIVCAFKDADGNEMGTTTLVVDALAAGASKVVEFYAPIGTATIEAAELNLNYVPDIVLPEVGSDIDVSKKKNRIRVSAAEASFNEDGTIHVVLTFKNYTSNWITEETDYVKYRCWNKGEEEGDEEIIENNKTLYIGVIDTKKHPVKTFEFDVPAETAVVEIYTSKIVYWTEWS